VKIPDRLPPMAVPKAIDHARDEFDGRLLMYWPQGQRAVILGVDPIVRPGEIHEVPILVRLGASVVEPFKANASRILNAEHCPIEFGLLRRPT
jgi:hypothetical protein